jgi:hypothetical protein
MRAGHSIRPGLLRFGAEFGLVLQQPLLPGVEILDTEALEVFETIIAE